MNPFGKLFSETLRRGLVLFGLCLLATSGMGLSAASGKLINGKKVIGYVPSYRGNADFVRYDKLTHINYAFLIVREDGSYTSEFDATLLAQVVSKAHAQGVQVLISVGGGSASTALGKAIMNATTPGSSATLKANLLQFMATYNLDGIDLDWEYPQTTAEATAFTSFVTGLATDVHAKGKLLTAATVGAAWVGNYYSDAAVAAFDCMNVMAYDVQGANHSTYQLAVDQLAYWAGRGVPASKLSLGVPFYGYTSPVFSWSAMAYKDILAADPSAYSKDLAAGYAYNGVPTMTQKTKLAMTNACGVMIWELSMDTAAGSASLLDAIYNTLSSGPVTTFTLTASAGSGGSISPSGAVKVAQGASQTFAITPSAGYLVQGVTVDGASVGSPTSYTFSNVTAGHTISATFKAIQYTLTASAGAGGTDFSSGTLTVNQGASQTYTITPNSGYVVNTVTVDGATSGALSTYSFSNIIANHVISATFKAIVVTSNLAQGKAVTASSIEAASLPASYAVDGSGTTRWASAYVDPSWIAVDLGSTLSFNRVVLRWEAAYGKAYQIQVSSDNATWTSVFTQSNGAGGVETITFPTVAARYVRMLGTARGTQWGYSLWEFEVYSDAVPASKTLTASAGAGGVISPSGAVKVSLGSSQTFTITPSAGYAINAVTVDGTSVGAVASYSFTNVTADHTIAATFRALTTNLALGKAVTASSVETRDFPASLAVDGNAGSRWASLYADPSWIAVDLGSTQAISRVVLKWEAAYGKAYQIQVSSNNSTWTTVASQANGAGGVETLTFPQTSARYVRMLGSARGTAWGYSLWEFEVY